ncbi:MAG: 4'-phosphopantetheinyl transferase superfamily protein [Oscillospiraceae bacterium]|nr:4'-phosphopantetheinyl transferase superfamily protein [Oscillospiraceae bacterium]
MVQVICVDVTGGEYQQLYAKASNERKARAERYLRQEDKLRCLSAEALLRYAVRRLLGLMEFTVENDSMGKPRLKDVDGFHFNLSHSGKWVAIACGSHPVGLDVQEMRGAVRESVLRQCYTPQEQRYVLEGDNQVERFYRVWTGKESYLKYMGVGIRKPMDSFSIFDLPDVVIHSAMLEGAYLSVCAEQSQWMLTRCSIDEII